MTLKNYYERLERETPPKTAFVKEIAEDCQVTEVTVRNWISYGIKPRDEAHIEILERRTGIKREDLWDK